MNQKNSNGNRLDTYFAFHAHTHYSFLDGFSTPEEYLRRCEELGIVGFGITEHGNMYSAPYFEKAKEEHPNVKVVYGVEFYEAFDKTIKNDNNKYFHLVCLAKNENGRIALNRLIEESSREENFYYKPRIDLESLKPYAEDLIFSSACLASKLAREQDFDKTVEYIKEYKSVLPNFYLEMQSHNSIEQIEYNKKILKLSEVTNTPYVITCDAHASSEEELKYQEYHVRIAKDMDTANEIYEGCFLQNVDTIYEYMIPQIGEESVSIGLQNTLDILSSIEDVKIPFKEPQLPQVELEGVTPQEKLRELVQKGFEDRKINKRYRNSIQEYMDRAEEELSVIEETGFASYFIIVWDFINFAKSKKMPISDGRGSAGGSLVLYLIGITNVDPIKYGLIFERFLNKERIGLPD